MEKVKLLVSKLCVAVHRSSTELRPVSIVWSVAFIGALEQLRDSSCVSEEKSLKKFFGIGFVGKTLTLTEKKDLEIPPSFDHSLAHVRSLCR